MVYEMPRELLCPCRWDLLAGTMEQLLRNRSTRGFALSWGLALAKRREKERRMCSVAVLCCSVTRVANLKVPNLAKHVWFFHGIQQHP